MKVTNQDDPGAKAFRRHKGMVGSAGTRSPGITMVDPLGNEATAEYWTVGGAIVTDNNDETAFLNFTGASGTGTPPWFNVIDYGAVGDGTTIDCDAINDAIDDMNAAGRGVLYFPPGSYLCNAGLNAITVPSMVIGEGRGSPSGAGSNTEIVCSSATATLFTIQDHVHFRDIQLRNSHSTPTAGALISVTSTGDIISFTGMLFRGGWMGLDIQEGGAQNVHDCWFTGQRKYSLKIRNISSPDGGDHAISDCWFYAFDAATADAAIRIESAGGAKITNCKFNFLNASGNYVHGIDVTPGATTTILLVANNSIENVTGDGIHVSGASYDQFIINGNQFGLYGNSTGNAIDINGGGGTVEEIVIANNIFKQTGGGSAPAINLTNVDNVKLVGNIRDGFGSMLATSGATNLINLDLLGATPGGELGGTWDSPTVDTTHSGSAHLALGTTSSTAAAGDHTHADAIGPILISDTPSTPLVFADLIQNEAQDDLVYADV